MAALVAAPAFIATALTPTAAHAGWRGGFFIGLPPVVVAPGPVGYPYYYPPAYYPPYYPAYPPAPYYPAPPPAGQAQVPPAQGSGKVAYGSMCYAGVYQCAAPAYTPIGQGCTCPGLGAPSYGTVQ